MAVFTDLTGSQVTFSDLVKPALSVWCDPSFWCNPQFWCRRAANDFTDTTVATAVTFTDVTE